MIEERIRSFIRDVPDFPEPGIVFKDITPLLGDHHVFSDAMDAMIEPYRDSGITKVVGVEARGFIFAAPIAIRLGTGFVPVRKPGKLPHDVHHQVYDLEYGTDRVEIHRDAATPDDNVLVVDDVLATGGTGRAATDLIRSLGAHVVGFAVLAELAFLGGRERMGGVDVHAVVRYGAS
ncbi:MAG: adenine phosphoribosyltransferase [Acidimicrobiia bacterium]|nr:adenine phosphoribosyltransferase [Acidimicrobiia bacterium]